MAQSIGFWSYTRRDDEREGGRIGRLANRLQDEYELITGDELEIFVDRDNLAWGDQWREKIDEAVDLTSFFIPVITPGFFKSAECRKELLRFAGKAKSLGVSELLMPIYYANVKELEDEGDPEDEAIALVKRTQWKDWRPLRLVDEGSAKYRTAINDLATRLEAVTELLLAKTELELGARAATGGEDEDDAPGYVEVLAEINGSTPPSGECVL